MTTYYIKKGRKYIPVAEREIYDTKPLGFHLVYVKPGCTSTYYNLEPNLSEVEAALCIAKEQMLEKMLEANKLKLRISSYPEELKQKAQIAFKEWQKIMGEQYPICFEGVSMNDIIDAGISELRKQIKNKN